MLLFYWATGQGECEFCFASAVHAHLSHLCTFRLVFRYATSPIDYRMNQEFRMSVTISVADFSEESVDAIMDE
jgi:hypothetical protein